MKYKDELAQNKKAFMGKLKEFDPQLNFIKVTLDETGVNPKILPKIIRSIANISYGTGYGDVTIHIKDNVVTHVKGNESDQLDEIVMVIAEKMR